MKKVLIALLLVMSLLFVSACGADKAENTNNTPAEVTATDTSATDASATDLSASDVSAADIIPAPEGFKGCEIGSLYFCYPEGWTADISENAATVSADKKTGANFTVTKEAAVDMVVSELSASDLDSIGEKGAAQVEAVLGEGVDAVYTYVGSGSVLEGKGVYFAFDITVNYTEYELSQPYSYYQMFIGEGKDVYTLTFATNTLYDDNAETYFADVIESVEIKTAE